MVIKKIDYNQVADIKQTLQKKGICIIKNYQIKDINDYIEYLKSIGAIYNKKNGSYYSKIQPNQKQLQLKNKHGYTFDFHFPHTDQPQTKYPPEYVILGCKKPAKEGGESLIINFSSLIQTLKQKHQYLYNILCEKDSVIFTDGDKSIYQSQIITKHKNNHLIRFKDDYSYFSTKLSSHINLLQTIILESSFSYKLNKNEILILNNHHYLHGRNKFKGDRILYRVLFSNLLNN